MIGPLLIPLWVAVLAPPAFVALMVANALTGGRVVGALDEWQARQIDRQFGWDVAPPGSPQHRQQIREMLDRDSRCCSPRKPVKRKKRRRSR